MKHLEVSGAVRHIYIYIYVIRRLKVNTIRYSPDPPPSPTNRQTPVLVGYKAMWSDIHYFLSSLLLQSVMNVKFEYFSEYVEATNLDVATKEPEQFRVIC